MYEAGQVERWQHGTERHHGDQATDRTTTGIVFGDGGRCDGFCWHPETLAVRSAESAQPQGVGCA
ncbi:hypothetical protein Misp05_13390 [Micromonospora sp. NBRC 107095]|nr:hypothetical protein Misp05_13390 [Micromonospora sp. NBRC 107095]